MTISDEVLAAATKALKAEFGRQLGARPLHGDTTSTDWHATTGVGTIELDLLARAAIEAAVEAEREECAKIAEIAVTHFHSDRIKIAAAIRNRKSGARDERG